MINFVFSFVGVETVNRDGKSSLFSLVKAFDSVLSGYEGFCNLKQVSDYFLLPSILRKLSSFLEIRKYIFHVL